MKMFGDVFRYCYELRVNAKRFLVPPGIPSRDRAAYEITLLSGGSSLSEGRSPVTGPLLADARLPQRALVSTQMYDTLFPTLWLPSPPNSMQVELAWNLGERGWGWSDEKEVTLSI